MTELDDQQLLREFAETNSETAFAALVERYVNLVYSTALRFTNNPHHAEEITQVVFIILARKAEKLSPNVVLSGWLYQAARLTAANFLKSERRRQFREQEVFMQSQISGTGILPVSEMQTETWKEIAPLLDEAMGKLSETDRNAVVLRFFENKTAAEVAAKLKLTEAAAHKRVNRALEKLRKIFAKRGVSSTTAIIAGMISANSVQAAPIGLAKTISVVAIGKGATASTSTLTLIKGALKVMAWTKTQTVIVISAAAILAVGTTTMIVKHQNSRLVLPKPQPVSSAETDFPKSSWAFAGYTNPQSALLSAIWSLSAGDLETFLASFTPSERERQLQQFKIGAQKAGESVAVFFTSIGTQGNMPNTTGFRVLDQQIISDDQVILRVSIQGTAPRKEQQVVEARMIKTGDEWKIDKFGPS